MVRRQRWHKFTSSLHLHHVPELVLMPRRRSKDPTTDIRITIPRSILDAIHDELEPTASRSRWIADACRDKLVGGSTIDDARSIQLATVLLNRGAITRTMYDMCVDYIKIMDKKSIISSSPSEEP